MQVSVSTPDSILFAKYLANDGPKITRDFAACILKISQLRGWQQALNKQFHFSNSTLKEIKNISTHLIKHLNKLLKFHLLLNYKNIYFFRRYVLKLYMAILYINFDFVQHFFYKLTA